MKRLAIGLCVLFSLSLHAEVTITLSKTRVRAGENITIQTADAPQDARVLLYENASRSPLTLQGEPNTRFSTSDFLEGGTYRVVVEQEGNILQEKTLVIEDRGLTTGGIMLVSDVHVMATELLQADGTAFQTAMAGDRKMLDQSEAIFHAMIDTALLYRPEALLISGDLTKDGELISHQAVVRELDRLREAGIRAFVVPGNHDIQNPRAVQYNGDKAEKVATIDGNQFAELYAHYGYNVAQRDTASLSYATELLSGVTLIGVDVVRWEDNTTSTRYDDGRMKPQTLQWVFDRVREARQEGKQVLLMQHQQLIEHHAAQREWMSSAAIASGDSIAALLAAAGVHVVLTGHVHIGDITTFRQGADSIVEISSGATVSYPVPYRWLSFSGDRTELTVVTRLLGRVGEIDDLGVYSREHLEKRTDNLLHLLVRSIAAKAAQAEETASFAGILLYEDKIVSLYSEPFRLALEVASEGNESRKDLTRIEALAAAATDSLAQYLLYEEGMLAALSLMLGEDLSWLQDLDIHLGTMLNGFIGAGMLQALVDDGTDDLFLTLSIPQTRTALPTNYIHDEDDDVWYDILGRPSTGSGLQIRRGQKRCVK